MNAKEFCHHREARIPWMAQQLYLIELLALQWAERMAQMVSFLTVDQIKEVIITTRINLISSASRQSPINSSWPTQFSLTDTRKVTILKTANYYLKCWDLTISLFGQCLRLQDSQQPNHMNGTSFGAPPAAKAIYMKALMNTKKLITFLRVTRLLGRIDFVSTSWGCKKSMESSTLTLYLTPTSYQTNSENSTSTTRSSNSTTARRTFGSSNQQTPPRDVVLIWSTTSMMSTLMSCQSFPDMSQIRFWSMVTSLIWEFTFW